MDPREKLIVSLKREVKVLRQENHYLRQQVVKKRKLSCHIRAYCFDGFERVTSRFAAGVSGEAEGAAAEGERPEVLEDVKGCWNGEPS